MRMLTRRCGVLIVVLAGMVLIASVTSMQAGTKSEGAFHTYHAEGYPQMPAEVCGGEWGELFVNVGDGVDTEWGPFDVDVEVCVNYSDWPVLQIFDFSLLLTFPRYDDTAEQTIYDTTVELVCEDASAVFDSEICEMVSDGGKSYRCRVTDAIGVLEGARGFMELNHRVALNMCLGEPDERAEMLWYTMHLHFPQGPKD